MSEGLERFKFLTSSSHRSEERDTSVSLILYLSESVIILNVYCKSLSFSLSNLIKVFYFWIFVKVKENIICAVL